MLRLICGIISSWICICTYMYGEGRRDVIYISDLDSLETILGIWKTIFPRRIYAMINLRIGRV